MPRDWKSYALPVTIDPEAYQAICVLIPDDTLYLGAFWRAYEYFTRWWAWERDPLRRGNLAAAVWKIGFDQARAQWEAGDRCMMQFLLRDDPDDPCRVQQSTDGGDTWEHAFSKDDCGGPVLAIPPYPGSGTGDHDGAGEAIRNIYIGLLDLNADCMLIREEYISAATAYLRLFDPTYSNPIALGELYDAYCGADPAVQDEAREECYYETLHFQYKDCWDDEGLIANFQCLAEKFGDMLDETADTVLRALVKIGAWLSGDAWQAASAGAPGGGGGGFGSECDWCHEWNYEIEEYDSFIHGALEIEHGQYVDGVGYQNDGQPLLMFRHQYDGIYQITRMEVDFTSDGGIHHESEQVRLNTQVGTFAGNPFNPTDPFPYQHMVHTGGGTLAFGRAPVATGYTQVAIQGLSDVFGTTWPTVTVTKFRVCGTGANPYVSV